MDLKPFMNLMVVLIPMLLVSAEFAKVAVVDMELPPDKGCNSLLRNDLQKTKFDRLNLTAIITDSTLTIVARGIILPVIKYKEYHHYIAKDDQYSFKVEHKAGVPVKHPLTGKEMEHYERNEIHLYVCDEHNALQNAFYTKYNELLLDGKGSIITNIEKDGTAFVMNERARMVAINDVSEIYSKPLSVYDELQKRLLNIRSRYADAQDRDELTIAAENRVVYDKIIQIMDHARAARFNNISISKLRT